MGYFLAIAGLYFLLFAILRQRPLLQYAMVMASLTALMYVDSGAPWSHFSHTTLVQRTIAHDVLEYLYFVLLAVFTATFLRLFERDRAAFIAVVVGTVLNATDLLADLVPVPAWLTNLGDPLTIVYFLALFAAGVRAWRAGMRPARYYSLAILMVLVGYGTNSLVSSVPALASFYNFIWLFEAAIALEALLLGIAVAERIRETAREYERLLVTSREFEDMALHDALTGVLNRRAFDRGFSAAWHAAAARRNKLGLLMIDIDHFKRYNDRYGHPEGDECLRRVAQACATCVRSGDLFARYGGEEFAAIVPSATDDDLEVIGRRMRELVAELAIEHDTPTGTLTLSIGGATKTASSFRSSKELIALADRALYRAKHEGRDRTILESER
jgi:diguanylate cyclase (GGDEF)-like protein